MSSSDDGSKKMLTLEERLRFFESLSAAHGVASFDDVFDQAFEFFQAHVKEAHRGSPPVTLENFKLLYQAACGCALLVQRTAQVELPPGTSDELVVASHYTVEARMAACREGLEALPGTCLNRRRPLLN